MNDPGTGPDWQDRGFSLRDIKRYIHFHIENLPRGTLVFRENAVDDPQPATELQPTDRQIEYTDRLWPATLIATDFTRQIGRNPEVLPVYSKVLLVFIHDYPACRKLSLISSFFL